MPVNCRNITIAAHIDHGKTTLSDSLLATNDLMNQQQQGKIRMLDFLPIEQQRCITVKSSCVSLVHLSTNYVVQKQFDKQKVPLLFHLFDSPGHCDFSQEVLSSFSLCDGALLVVDVVEGVRSQTIQIIKQLFSLKIDIVLCVNKCDRLVGELKLTPIEAFYQILNVVAQTNTALEEIGGASNFFSLERNVVVAAGVAGWGLFLPNMVTKLQEVVPFLKDINNTELCGFLARPDAHISGEKIAIGPNTSPLFVSLILDPIWKAYEYTSTTVNEKKLKKLFKQLNGCDLPDNDLSLEGFMRRSYELGKSVFDAVAINVKPPTTTSNAYLSRVLKTIDGIEFGAVFGKRLLDLDIEEPVKTDVKVRHFSLMRIIKQNELNQFYPGSTFQCVDGKSCRILNLFQPMGKAFKKITNQQFAAGCILGVETDRPLPNNSLVFQKQVVKAKQEENFAEIQLISSKASVGSIDQVQISSDELAAISAKFLKAREKSLQIQKPLIKVNVIPDVIQNYVDLYKKVFELATQQMSIEAELTQMGDIQLIICGDVHLDLCIEELKKVVNYDFRVSTNYLQVLETVVAGQSTQIPDDMVKCEQILTQCADQYDQFTTKMDTFDLSQVLTFSTNFPNFSQAEQQTVLPIYNAAVAQKSGRKNLNEVGFEGIISDGSDSVQQFKLFGFACPQHDVPSEYQEKLKDEHENRLFITSSVPSTLQPILEKAFYYNMLQGPLCFEQMQNVCICFDFVQQSTVVTEHTYVDVFRSQALKNYFIKVSSSYPSLLNELTLFSRQVLSQANLRVMEKHLCVQIASPLDQTSAISILLSKIRAKNVAYEKDISAYVPQQYALELGSQLRQETSGLAQLVFKTAMFIMNEEDPRHYDVALTVEEEIEFGAAGKLKKSDQKAQKGKEGGNSARAVVVNVLRQKGLYVEELVEDAEKQRTVKRNR